MLRQIELGGQNGRITKNGILTLITLIFWKFCFSLRTSYIQLIWYSNYPNDHIHTFRKLWIFVWVCFFPVSILNVSFYLLMIHKLFKIRAWFVFWPKVKRFQSNTSKRIIIPVFLEYTLFLEFRFLGHVKNKFILFLLEYNLFYFATLYSYNEVLVWF